MVAVHTGTSTSTLTKLTVLQEAVRVITDLENRLRGTGWPLRNAASSVGDAAPVCRPCPYVLCMNLCCRVIHVRIGTRLEVLYRYPSLAIRQRLNILNQIHTHTRRFDGHFSRSACFSFTVCSSTAYGALCILLEKAQTVHVLHAYPSSLP